MQHMPWWWWGLVYLLGNCLLMWYLLSEDNPEVEEIEQSFKYAPPRVKVDMVLRGALTAIPMYVKGMLSGEDE